MNILLVDDDHPELLAKKLNELGAVVFTAKTAMDAETKIESGTHFDLLILDSMIPDTEGKQPRSTDPSRLVARRFYDTFPESRILATSSMDYILANRIKRGIPNAQSVSQEDVLEQVVEIMQEFEKYPRRRATVYDIQNMPPQQFHENYAGYEDDRVYLNRLKAGKAIGIMTK